MTDAPTDPLPSVDLDAETLDAAPFVLVIRHDGTVYVNVKHDVDDAALAAYLHQIAETFADGSYRDHCPTCAAGLPHTDDPALPSGHDEAPTRP